MSYCTMHGDGTFPLTIGEHDTHDSLRACGHGHERKGRSHVRVPNREKLDAHHGHRLTTANQNMNRE